MDFVSSLPDLSDTITCDDGHCSVCTTEQLMGGVAINMQTGVSHPTGEAEEGGCQLPDRKARRWLGEPRPSPLGREEPRAPGPHTYTRLQPLAPMLPVRRCR